jgi:selenide,water dikinase
MGGRVLTAMNIACFPIEAVSSEVLGTILAGGAELCAEAGASVVGGHTVEDDTLKYGLSVTGVVDPKKMIVNTLAKPGDVLVLTKALGTGIVNTAAKKDKASPEHVEAAIRSMEILNKAACEAAVAAGVRAGTDITGFGLIGHAMNIARGSDVTIEVDASKIPLLPGTLEYAKKGLCTGGAKSNAEHFAAEVDVRKEFADIVWDPQTSGGLLLAIPEARLGDLMKELEARKVETRAVIGRVLPKGAKRIVVR